jgi:hypothetical protein
MPQVKFYRLLETYVKRLLDAYSGKDLTPDLMHSIRNTIHDRVASVFNQSKQNVSDKAVRWLTDQLFKSIKVDDMHMADLVVINEYVLSELNDHDVQLLHDLFCETTFGFMLTDELRTRKVPSEAKGS